jgi:hypothetical protein
MSMHYSRSKKKEATHERNRGKASETLQMALELL